MLRLLLTCLLLTLAAELAAALPAGLRGRDLALVGLVNVLTNPVVVVAHTLFPSLWVTAALEVSAVAVEALYYRRFGARISHPWRFSLCANSCSFGLGLIITLIGG